jgi:hypothetical protein
MRNPDACVGPIPAYHLKVTIGNEVQFDSRIEASGARGDRPLFVYRELFLPPGKHAVRVSFAPEDLQADSPEVQAADSRGLYLDTVLELNVGEVRLVTRNEDTGALEVALPRG